MDLEMSAEEISRWYRLAKNRRKQIKILSELNLCRREKIMEILKENGEALPEAKKKAANWTEQEEKQLIGLRESGLTASQIAKEMNTTQSRVASKLARLKASELEKKPQTQKEKPTVQKGDFINEVMEILKALEPVNQSLHCQIIIRMEPQGGFEIGIKKLPAPVAAGTGS